MRRAIMISLLSVFISPVMGQVRLSKLVLKPKEIYELGQSDILVADTLVMMDSSRIILNRLKRENYIRVQVAFFGKGCSIDGAGMNGKLGRKGRSDEAPIGPCKDGTPGRAGARGLDGTPGINLFIYFGQVTVKGKIRINLSGGNAGNGGDGGNGGGGSPGTVHCIGGNGGTGGNGASGGNGGEGGILTVSCEKCLSVQSLVHNNIKLMNAGGQFGYGGRGGYGGPAGLGPSKRNGKVGEDGIDGVNGQSGKNGTLNLATN